LSGDGHRKDSMGALRGLHEDTIFRHFRASSQTKRTTRHEQTVVPSPATPMGTPASYANPTFIA